MSMDADYRRCTMCGNLYGNAPTPGPGECSCIHCEECGEPYPEGATFCKACDDNYDGDEPSGGMERGELSAQLASYQTVK